MNNFDYAGLIHLLETRLSKDTNMTLYVCSNKLCKNRFKKKHKDISNAIILTIDEIWYDDRLTGLRYSNYEIIM